MFGTFLLKLYAEESDKSADSQGLMDLATGDEDTQDADESPTDTAQDAQGGENGKEGDPGDGSKPDWLPEQFWNADKGEPLLEQMAKSYGDLRTELNKVKQSKTKKGEVPETAEDYIKEWKGLDPERTIDGKTQTLSNCPVFDTDDPALKAAAVAAQKAGMSKTQFEDFVADFLFTVNDALPEPYNEEKELASLGGREKALPLLNINKTWLENLAKKGILQGEERDHLLWVAGTAQGVKAINKIRQLTGEKEIPMDQIHVEGAKTLPELEAMMADPRYSEDGPAGEAYRKQVADEYRKAFPNDSDKGPRLK